MSLECLNVYITACRLAMMRTPVNCGDSNRLTSKLDPIGNQSSCYTEMYNVLSSLRNFLSCYKCGKLASDAVKLSKEIDTGVEKGSESEQKDADGGSSEVEHSSVGNGNSETSEKLVICEGCAERIVVKSSEPRTQIRTLVLCFVKLCQYLQSTGFCGRNVGAASSRIQRDLTQLIMDAVCFKDAGESSADCLLSRILTKPSGGGVKRSISEMNDGKGSTKGKQGKIGKYRSRAGLESNGGGDRKGCQCGHSAPRSGVTLTCFGQRCPCYSNGLGCFNCKCRGCKNPKNRSGTTVGSEQLENLRGGGSCSASSSTSSSTISSSCSSSPHPEDNL